MQRKSIIVLLDIMALIICGLGLLFAYFDITGLFEKSERKAFLNWVLKSDSGLSINEPSARAFMKEFPPPSEVQISKITHIVKWKMNLQNGLPTDAQINYMFADQSRTAYVATLDDVRQWVYETSYPWVAWICSLVGFLVLLINRIIGWCTKSTEKVGCRQDL